MNVRDRQEEFKKFSEEQGKILLGKGHDYTAGRAEEDAYANFRIVADLLKGAPITSYTVTMIYLLKHVLSLITYAKTGHHESGESLRGRHLDVANYAFILEQLSGVDEYANLRELDNLKSELKELRESRVRQYDSGLKVSTKTLKPEEDPFP